MAIREGIQVIYQDFSLFPNLTVAENLAINTLLEQKRRLVNWREVRQIAREAIAQIGVNLNLNELIAELSVAEKQLIAIARALLHDAKLIIMDEPTTALTQREVTRLFQIIKKLQQDGISILFVSHKLREILDISENITVLRNGKVVAEGKSTEFDQTKLVYAMTGRELTEKRFYFQQQESAIKTRLRVVNLSKKDAFKNISFDLRPGEILGITGLLGSGRSELAVSLFGVAPIDAGQIYINDKPVRIHSVQDAMRHGLAYVPEDRLTEGLFLEQSIEKNIIITVLKTLLNRCKLLNYKKAHSLANHSMNELQIVAPTSRMAVQCLSGGNQQKTVLAKWLAAKAKILVLNGPTVGVDIGAKMDLHEKIRTLAKRGRGLIIISDDIPELMQTCNRVLLMHRGEIIDEYSTIESNENQLVERMRRLK